ncbi:GNAT family N-acetyltransferase [Candidatus Persebacteraceae bacterium Df01]|jgi:phosphinothricin acetyltransferase|uniref:GNAT family N-acetyltransferase n=1 Tax=Candidatus Doriopsillibacter californiensis TaxID=2970740 RepID=A0ABT7QJW5_9GAMM|nr:GNAT family N-acetyltransferase [Candidatus Persebacteraceae bacterium Df01]
MSHTLIIRDAITADAATCAAIYEHYVLHTTNTFQEKPLPPSHFSYLIEKADIVSPFLAAAEGDDVVGYAYADIWRTRCAFRYTVEVSAYVQATRLGEGIGGKLLSGLLQALAASDVRLAVAVIALPNSASVRMHEKFDFVHSGTLSGAGWKFGAPHDVGFWSKKLHD